MYDDDQIVKLPQNLLNNEECMNIISADIEYCCPDWIGMLVIDEPYRYLDILYNFYGSYPPDVDDSNMEMTKLGEEGVLEKELLDFYLMSSFSFIIDDDSKISDMARIVGYKGNLPNVIDYISFMYGRYKYKLSQHDISIMYTMTIYTSGSFASFKSLMIDSEFTVHYGYNVWVTLRYYVPLFDRNIPNPRQIDWVKIQDPESVLNLLTDNEIINTSDITKLDDFYPLRSRHDLIKLVSDSMKKERFRYMDRRLIVCNQDEIYGSEFQNQDYGTVLTYGIQSGDVNKAYMKCINEESLAEYFEKRMGFYEPYNNKRLSKEDVKYLKSYAKSQVLKDSIDEVKKMSNYPLINELFEENENNVINFIQNLFFAGMYIRRWKGFGHGYPIDAASTKISICTFFIYNNPQYLKEVILTSPGDFHVDLVKSVKKNNFNFDIENIGTLQYSFESYIREYLHKIVMNIKMQPELNTLLIGNRSFEEYFGGVMNAQSCIRMASSDLILLAWNLAKYLKEHIDPNVIIPDFNDDLARGVEVVG